MSEKWIKARLGDIGEITKGSGISRDESNSGSLAAVRYGELYTHHDEYVKRYVSRISEDVARGAKLTKKGDVVFAGSGETPDDIGKCAALLDDGVYAGGDLVVFSPPTAESPIYWGCLLNMPYVQRQKASFAHGSSIYHLRPGEVARIEVAYANNVSTQRHIAEVLSTCDEVIEQSERAAEKYRQIKEGMLKDLLTRGIDMGRDGVPPPSGNAVGRDGVPPPSEMGGNAVGGGTPTLPGKLRPPPSVAPELYKDSELGPIPKEWEVKRLGDCALISRGGSPRPIEDYVFENAEGYNWIKIGDVEPGAKYIVKTAEKMIPAGLVKTREVHVGDFLLSNSMSFGRPYILKIDGCIHDGWLAIQDYKETFDKEYLYYVLGAPMVLRQYGQLAAGSTVLNLKKEMVAKVLVAAPVDLAEQRAIAERLAAVDERIAAEVKTAEKYRKVKAGLMEKLLTPPPDAEIEEVE